MGGGALTGGSCTIAGNEVSHLTPGFDTTGGPAHGNVIETLGGPTNFTYYIHDNVFHDSSVNTESGYIANIGTGTVTFYLWNNIWYNMLGNSPEIENAVTLPSQQGPRSYYVWNNTVVPKAGAYGFAHSSKAGLLPTTIVIQNNHSIATPAGVGGPNNGIDPNIVATSLTVDHNILQSPTAAALQGYTVAQTPYVYAPTLITGDTVLQGVELSSQATGGVAGLQFDTTYGSVLSGTTVSGAGRSANTRPTGSAWDVGAYFFVDVDVTPPAAPTGIRVI